MSGGKIVILVESNLFFTTKISAGLKQLGYGVEVERSFEGVRKKTGEETEAIILNLSAPGIDPLEIIKNLKNSPETARIPLIAFSGHRDQEKLRSAAALGCELTVANSAIVSGLPALLNQLKMGKINPR